jgi:hypothetical protein
VCFEGFKRPRLERYEKISRPISHMTCGSNLSFTPFLLLFFLCSPVPRDLRLDSPSAASSAVAAAPLHPSPSSVATPSLPTLLLPYCSSSATSPPPPEPDHCLPPSAFSNLGSTARRLNSSRPRPISSIRSPRRNPERRLRSVERHLGPSVLATSSGAASAPAPVAPRPSLLSYFATRHLGRRRAPPGHQVFPPLGPPFLLCEAVRPNLNVICRENRAPKP